MSQGIQGTPRRAPTKVWIYLGASGVLQPLSEEFLYRSPSDPARHVCRWWPAPPRRQDHAAF